MGYKVIDAEDGHQALTLIKQLKTPIDLLITDVIMPEMSGKDLALRIQALFPDLKVVFISGYLDDIIGNQGILEPGIQFIQKPIKIEALAQKIRETLDSISSPGSIHGKSHLLT
jgi:YesN/AraC family two-component response regulator